MFQLSFCRHTKYMSRSSLVRFKSSLAVPSLCGKLLRHICRLGPLGSSASLALPPTSPVYPLGYSGARETLLVLKLPRVSIDFWDQPFGFPPIYRLSAVLSTVRDLGLSRTFYSTRPQEGNLSKHQASKLSLQKIWRPILGSVCLLLRRSVYLTSLLTIAVPPTSLPY
jgi:hypothetical protein